MSSFASTDLVAITRPLASADAAALNLLTFAGDDGLLFLRDGVGLAARGQVLEIDMPTGTADVGHVAAILRSIESDDDLQRSGTGPIAFGALPFRPGEPGKLFVPQIIVAKSSDGTAWCTHIGRKGDVAWHVPALVADRVPAWSPHSFDLRSSVSHEVWCQKISTAVQRIQTGELDKVVLARSVDVEATIPFVIGDILARLQALFPSCNVFNIKGFLGASPELLVSRKGSQVRAHPLAGTVARSGDPVTDAKLAAGLLASPKDRWEHSLVIDAVAEVLRPLCDELDVPATPSVLLLRNVSHLATLITGSLKPRQVLDGTAPTALECASVLNPTPAVGGVPQAKALALIDELEPEERGNYAGPVGWVDAAGNGEWAVGLRSAMVTGTKARMFAGGGIVSDSDPLSELQETQLKLQALLSAVVRP